MPEMLTLEQQLLSKVIEAATKSAEGATASAAAISSLEQQLAEVKTTINACAAELDKLVEERQKATETQKERSEWLRSLLTPQTVYYTLILLLAMFGIRLSLPVPMPDFEQPKISIESSQGDRSEQP